MEKYLPIIRITNDRVKSDGKFCVNHITITLKSNLQEYVEPLLVIDLEDPTNEYFINRHRCNTVSVESNDKVHFEILIGKNRKSLGKFSLDKNNSDISNTEASLAIPTETILDDKNAKSKFSKPSSSKSKESKNKNSNDKFSLNRKKHKKFLDYSLYWNENHLEIYWGNFILIFNRKSSF